MINHGIWGVLYFRQAHFILYDVMFEIAAASGGALSSSSHFAPPFHCVVLELIEKFSCLSCLTSHGGLRNVVASRHYTTCQQVTVM